MSVPQWILLALIGLTTWGACVEGSTDPRHKITPGRFALALVAPLAWAALVVLPPWHNWPGPLLSQMPQWGRLLLEGFLFIMIVAGTPAWFVFTIVVWVGMALTGELQEALRAKLRRTGRGRS